MHAFPVHLPALQTLLLRRTSASRCRNVASETQSVTHIGHPRARICLPQGVRHLLLRKPGFFHPCGTASEGEPTLGLTCGEILGGRQRAPISSSDLSGFGGEVLVIQHRKATFARERL
jgi:hypothetical protein